MLEHLLDDGQDLPGRQARQDQRPPGHAQADAERRLGRPVPADVADQRVHPAVGGLHHVVEVAAEQALLAAGQAAGRYGQPRVGQQRRGQQAPLEPGVLLRVDPRRRELPLRLFRVAALDGVPDHAVQHVAGSFALDQVVLRPGPDRLPAEVFVGYPGEHDDGRLGRPGEQPAKTVQALRIGQAEIQEHAGRAGHQELGLGERPGALQGDGGSRLV